MTLRTPRLARDLHVVGGGCFGTQYVKWLLKARDKGMARFRRIFAVDRDPQCRLKREGISDPELTIVLEDWIEYFSHYLSRSRKDPDAGQDRWVPSPLSPHILFRGFLQTGSSLGLTCEFMPAPFGEEVPTPVRIPLSNGDLAVSFAEWQCPVNCIEPPNCPAIQNTRTWDMKRALTSYFHNQNSWRSAHVLQCRHWVHGVGTIPMGEILEEFRIFSQNCGKGEIREVVVATTSGCHGLISRAKINRLQA